MFEEDDNERKYTYQYVPPEQHHSGYDEGYYWCWCDHCNTETEQDDGFCFSCKK